MVYVGHSYARLIESVSLQIINRPTFNIYIYMYDGYKRLNVSLLQKTIEGAYPITSEERKSECMSTVKYLGTQAYLLGCCLANLFVRSSLSRTERLTVYFVRKNVF